MKGEKKFQINKKSAYLLALCAMFAVSGTVYAKNQGKNKAPKEESEQIDWGEQPDAQTPEKGQPQDSPAEGKTTPAPGVKDGHRGNEGENTSGLSGDAKNEQKENGGQDVSGESGKSVREKDDIKKEPDGEAESPSDKAGEMSSATENETTGSQTEPGEPQDSSKTTGNADKTAGNSGTQSVPAVNPDVVELHFPVEKGLVFAPGYTVLKSFSSEEPVYFETLAQFRTNPAVMLKGEAGETVIACAEGVVKEISAVDKLGTTVTMDLGDGYEMIYGQLSDVSVRVGDHVKAGDGFAKLAEPTKYFATEGSHLYLQLLKEGAPIDPMSYKAAEAE